MLSKCELNFEKTSKSKKNNYYFKTRYSKRYTRRSAKRLAKSNFSVSLEDSHNNVGKSLTRRYISKDSVDEPLYLKYSKVKQRLKKREEQIIQELKSVKGALKQTLENNLLPTKRRINRIKTDKSVSKNIDFVYETSSEKICLMQNSSVCTNDSLFEKETKSTVTEKDYSDSMCKTKIGSLYVSAKAEESGDFEVKTEHPRGSIKTYIMHSSSGNVEIVTQIEDFNEKPVQVVRSEQYSAVPHLIVPPSSISTTNILREKNTPTISETTNNFKITNSTQELIISEKPSMKEIKTSNVYEHVNKVVQKLNDTVVYALEQINKNISKALDSLNQNIKLALTVVIRDEIQKVIDEHLPDKKTLVCSSTSHDNLFYTEEKEVYINASDSESKELANATLDDLKTFTCSASFTLSKFVSNQLSGKSNESLQTASMQTISANNAFIQTSNEILELKHCVSKSTSITKMPPSEPLQKNFSEEVIDSDCTDSLKVVYGHKLEDNSRPTSWVKRKVRSTKLTKLTNPTNQEQVDASYGSCEPNIDNQFIITPNAVLSTKSLTKFSSYVYLSATTISVSSRKGIIEIDNLDLLKLPQPLEDSSSSLKVIGEESTTQPLQFQTTEISSPKNEPMTMFFSVPNSVYSTPTMSGVTQVTEDLSPNDASSRSDDEQTDDTFVTSNAQSFSQKNIDSSSSRSETVQELTPNKPKLEMRVIRPISRSGKRNNSSRDKKRRFNKCSLIRCGKSLINVGEKLHKPTVSKILKRNNALKQLTECQDTLTPIKVSQVKEYRNKPHSAGCDCFDCVYAEYCRKNKRSTDSERHTKIDECYHNLMAQKIYDTHVKGIEKNFERHEKIISNFEEKIKEAYKYAESNEKMTKIYKTRQKSSFEATLCGLQRALHSLRTKLQRTDHKAKTPLSEKRPKKNQNHGRSSILFYPDNDKQTQNTGKKNIGVKKVKSDIGKKSKRNVDILKSKTMAPTTSKPIPLRQSKKNLGSFVHKTVSHSTTAKTKSKQQKTSFTQTFNSKEHELSCIRSCEQELKHFLLTQRRCFQNTQRSKKSISSMPINTAKPSRNPLKNKNTKKKRKTGYSSTTETTIKSVPMSKVGKRKAPTSIMEDKADKKNKWKLNSRFGKRLY